MQNRNYDLRVDVVYRVPGEAPSRVRALLLYLIVAVGLLVSSVAVGIVKAIFPDMGYWMMQTLTTIIYYAGAFILPLAVFRKKGGRGSMLSMRPNPMPGRTALIAVALAIIGVYFANNLSVLWSLPFDAMGFNIYVSSIPAPENIGQLLLAVFAVGIAPGLCEELVFRGFMQPAFEQKGTKRAVLFVSLLFALLHGSVVGLPAQFILGLAMGILLVLTDSIYPSIIFHTVYNSATMILLYLQTRAGIASPAAGEMFEFLGAGGLVLMLIQLPMQGAAIFFILRSLYCRAKNSGVRFIAKQPMRLRGGEIALLCVSLALAALYYLLDILAMTGVLM